MKTFTIHFNYRFALSMVLVFMYSGISAQQLLRAKVISADDRLPVAGAYISAVQSRSSAFSARDGSFSLTLLQASDSIRVSFIGYATLSLRVQVPQAEPLIISLSPQTATLEEVKISTGYYQLPAERATGSFTVVDTKQFNQSVGPDILSRLKGQVSSLLFDERAGATNISVRGRSTIFAETQPLIVLNNFPFNGDISSINPNDVESITILKDAAAASIWGVRAANGVIVITTKRGRETKAPVITLNANVSVAEKPDMFYRPSISSADFIEVERFLFSKGFYTSKENDVSKAPITPAAELLIAARDGKISAADAQAQIEALKTYDVRNDFSKYLYQNSLNRQYSMNMQGGGERNTWYYSAGYDLNSDFTADQYGRLSLRADNTYKLGKKFKLNPVLSYSQTKNKRGRSEFSDITSGSALSLYPYARLADDEGRPLPVTKNYRDSFVKQAESAGLGDWEYVPLEDMAKREFSSEGSNLMLSINSNYELPKGFDMQLQYQYERSWDEVSDLNQSDSYYARNLLNSYAQPNGTGTFAYPLPAGGILDLSSSGLNGHTGRGQLNYSGSFNRHQLNALAGTEIRQVGSSSALYRTYGYDQSGLQSKPVDYMSTYGQYYNTGRKLSISYNNSFGQTLNRYTSFYVNAAYSFDNRYVLTGSVRKDASNLFGVSSNQKGVPLWSAGLAWNLHQEAFFKSGWVDFLKLKMTYGYNGNLSKGLTALATISQASGNLNGQPYANVRTYPNPELRWEQVGVYNAGIDFGVLKNRLSGSIEYYRKTARDLIAEQPVDPTVGVISGTVRKNVADMRGEGIDVQLTSKNLAGAFRWSTGLVFNYNTNKVTGYKSMQTRASAYITSGLGTVPLLGKPVQSVLSYKWAGLDPANGNPRGYYKGQLTSSYGDIVFSNDVADLEYHGSALPVSFGNISNTFAYNGFSVYANITCRLGYYFQRPSLSYNSLYNNWFGHSDFSRRWQQAGDELFTDVPSMVYPNNINRDEFYSKSSALVEKGDNIRLQDLNFSYQLDKRKWKLLPFGNLQLYLHLRNAGFLWRANERGIDPDFTGFLPASRSASLGIKAGF